MFYVCDFSPLIMGMTGIYQFNSKDVFVFFFVRICHSNRMTVECVYFEVNFVICVKNNYCHRFIVSTNHVV